MVVEVKTKAEFDQALSAAGDKLVVVDFTAAWCGPCQRIKPAFEAMSKEITDVVFIKVDVDTNAVKAPPHYYWRYLESRIQFNFL
jgi:thioredoxin 1